MKEINIRLRQEQLRDLQEYVKDIDKDITLILQSLQWDRKKLLQGKQMTTCKFDSNHRVLADNVKEHEEKCYLKSQNYVPGDLFFPEPLDANAVVKLSAENINDIINYAVKTDPSFKRRSESSGPSHTPLTLGCLQAAYSADERRALYDAVVAAAPPPTPCNTLDRDLATHATATTSARPESRGDALLAMRDARRRRARHRGAARDGYQHELRELISAQMESFIGKWNEEDADSKSEVRIDESDEGRRCENDSDRRDHGRNNDGSKYLNKAYGKHTESREGGRREYEKEKRTTEHEREYRKEKKKEYKRESRDNQRREYQRDSREDKRRENEYDKKYTTEDDRRRQTYDKEYFEIKQEKDDYPSPSRKRKERRYDYKDREQGTDRSSSRDSKKYHKRDEHYHKQKSAKRSRDRYPDREYSHNDRSDIDCSYLKIKKEPDYD